MAREKSWSCVQNIALSGTTDTTLAQNWMYELYTFLSGGAGNSTSAWEILSASNSLSVGGPGTISGTGSFIWNASGAHSWFTCRKDILPVTASTTRYIYLTVDCEDTDNTKAYFGFDYSAPNFAVKATDTRPAETSNCYEQDGIQFMYSYDVSNQTYFHGTIDETGSFHIIGARKDGVTSAPYNFALSCARLETPRSADIDPFPVLLRCNYSRNQSPYYGHGCWSLGDNGQNDHYNNLLAGNGMTNWSNNGPTTTGKGGFAMWWVDGGYAADGQNAGCFIPSPDVGIASSPIYDMPSNGSVIDGTYPLLPMYIGHYFGSGYTSNEIRGRLPDVFFCAGSVRYVYSTTGWGAGGLTVPLTGDIEYSVASDCFFPFSASLQPGG
jgi:hypothetical protein